MMLNLTNSVKFNPLDTYCYAHPFIKIWNLFIY